MKHQLRLHVLSFTVLFTTLAMLTLAPMLASASTGCRGSGCNGTDPAATRCNQNAFLAKRFVIPDIKYGLAMWDTYADIYYSRSCGTNWVRVTQNPFGGKTFKSIWTSKYTELETDYGYGASYSMQVYAPGSTRIDFVVKLFDKKGTLKAYTYQYLK